MQEQKELHFRELHRHEIISLVPFIDSVTNLLLQEQEIAT
jgi:hypothetical protein